MGIAERLGKLSRSLAKTREAIAGKVSRMVSSRRAIDENLLEELEELLISADVGVDSSSAIIGMMKDHVEDERYSSGEELNELLRQTMITYFADKTSTKSNHVSSFSNDRPHVILVVGVNGVGKTTTVGKLASFYAREGKKVMIAASDTFRAAANEQLRIWSDRASASIVSQREGADPGAVAFDAFHSAKRDNSDILLVDTAGRLHTRANLMEELKKIRRVLKKADPTAPHEVLLVVDAGTGQNALEQAKRFSREVGVTGLVLTKLDGTAKGGIVLAILSELQIPVKFVGLGEGIDDLEPFDSGRFVDALFSPLALPGGN